MLPLTLDRAVADDSGGTAAISAEPEVLSLWIPLAAANEDTGCLKLVRGSHRSGLIPMTRQAGSRFAQPAEQPGELVVEPMEFGDGKSRA